MIVAIAGLLLVFFAVTGGLAVAFATIAVLFLLVKLLQAVFGENI